MAIVIFHGVKYYALQQLVKHSEVSASVQHAEKIIMQKATANNYKWQY